MKIRIDGVKSGVNVGDTVRCANGWHVVEKVLDSGELHVDVETVKAAMIDHGDYWAGREIE